MSDQGMRCVRRQWENLTTFACSLLNYQGTQLLNGPNLKKRPIVQTIGNLPVVAGTMLAFAFHTLLLLLLSSCYMSAVVKSLQNVAVLCTRFCRRRRRCCSDYCTSNLVFEAKERVLQYSSDGRLMTFNNSEARVVRIVNAANNNPVCAFRLFVCTDNICQFFWK